MTSTTVKSILIVLILLPAAIPCFSAQRRSIPDADRADSIYSLYAEMDQAATGDTASNDSRSAPIPRQNKRPAESSPATTKKPWPTGALIRSALLPGWGQLYNRKYIKAAFYGGLEIYLLVGVRENWKKMNRHQENFLNTVDPTYKSSEFNLYQESRDKRNVFLWLGALTVFVSMFDAYVDAHFADFDKTDKAFEVQIFPRDDLTVFALACNFR